MPLKISGNNNFLTSFSKQSYNNKKLQSVYNIQRKRVIVVESNDVIIDLPVSRKKFKKLTEKKSIAAKIDK